MARLNKTRRARVQALIPPAQCEATIHSTGRRCLKPATVGALVCHTHGAAAPQVRAAAEKRVTLAEAMVSGPKRQPYEVLEDALHAADLLMREVIFELSDSGTAGPALIEKFTQAFERAHRLAKVNMDAGIDQRRIALAEAQAGQMHRVFTRVLAALELTPEQKALVPGLLKREIEGVMVRQEIAA